MHYFLCSKLLTAGKNPVDNKYIVVSASTSTSTWGCCTRTSTSTKYNDFYRNLENFKEYMKFSSSACFNCVASVLLDSMVRKSNVSLTLLMYICALCRCSWCSEVCWIDRVNGRRGHTDRWITWRRRWHAGHWLPYPLWRWWQAWRHYLRYLLYILMQHVRGL